MKKILVSVLSIIKFFSCYAQIDTSKLYSSQKGILFLSDYNYQYDYYEGQEMNPLGFHDFFFPTDSFDVKLMFDSTRKFDFINGIRVDFIKDRKSLKKKSQLLLCKDTSGCYGFDKFYIIPVVIDYKNILEYEPLICWRSYFDIKVLAGSLAHFEYFQEAIRPTKILPHFSRNIKKRTRHR